MNTLPAKIRVVDISTMHGGSVVSVGQIDGYNSLAIPAYFRAMMFLSQNMASFPRSVRQRAKDGNDAAAVPHALDNLLMFEPNGYQDAFMFWQALFFGAAHRSNGYARIDRDRTGRPVALHNVAFEDVEPFRVDFRDGRGWQQFYDIAGEEQPVHSSNMLHIARMSYDGMIGIDPVAMQETTLRRAALMKMYVNKFLERGSVIRAAIELPDGVDDVQAEQIVDRVKRHYSGPEADKDIIVLPGGAKLNAAGVTPEQGQLAQQSALTTKDIAMITGVPPQFLYEASEAKYVNNVEQAGTDVVRFTFRPWIEQAESQLNLKLLSRAERQAGLRLNIDPDALLRGDTKAFSDMIQAQVKAGLMTRNEGRLALGLPKFDDPTADKLMTLGDTNPLQLPQSPSS